MKNTEQKIATFAKKFGWNDIEVEHAMNNMENTYEDESVVNLINGREIRTPTYPKECSYLRITQEGFELAYWISDEWKDDPECVMGAIMGCAHGA